MKLGYTLFYVDDVEETLKFYNKAFGLKTAFLHESKQYGELETGDTKLGFVNHETAGSHGFKYKKMTAQAEPMACEIGLVTKKVAEAYEQAIKAGAVALSPPKEKPWGQLVSYVRDCNGFLVEICSPM